MVSDDNDEVIDRCRLPESGCVVVVTRSPETKRRHWSCIMNDGEFFVRDEPLPDTLLAGFKGSRSRNFIVTYGSVPETESSVWVTFTDDAHERSVTREATILARRLWIAESKLPFFHVSEVVAGSHRVKPKHWPTQVGGRSLISRKSGKRDAAAMSDHGVIAFSDDQESGD
jgi:hypothetical protein